MFTRARLIAATAAVGLLAGASTADAIVPVTPAVGHYYTTVQTISLTPTGGATATTCGNWGGPGASFVGVTLLSLDVVSKKLGEYLRYTVSTSATTAQVVVGEKFVQGSTSSFLNQSGTLTIYYDGASQFSTAYQATVTVIDGRSFSASVTVDLPPASGSGSCTQVNSATFVHSAGY